jgi:hypothetical protein
MTNEGECEALGEGELCPIDGIKGQKGLCILSAFAVSAFLTAETQKITREKKPLRSRRLCGKKQFNRRDAEE